MVTPLRAISETDGKQVVFHPHNLPSNAFAIGLKRQDVVGEGPTKRASGRPAVGRFAAAIRLEGMT